MAILGSAAEKFIERFENISETKWASDLNPSKSCVEGRGVGKLDKPKLSQLTEDQLFCQPATAPKRINLLFMQIKLAMSGDKECLRLLIALACQHKLRFRT